MYYQVDTLDKVEGEQCSWMQRFLPLLIGVTVTLLAGCVDKREVCATAMSGATKDFNKVRKQLGIGEEASVWKYCEYYK